METYNPDKMVKCPFCDGSGEMSKRIVAEYIKADKPFMAGVRKGLRHKTTARPWSEIKKELKL
ncbi:MAG: hypothetical protein Q8P44_03900 [Dehalococcoidia bacterium]|nr:hypothetical protein [Dehalococcoidia bacterium]